jgi:hypothetical protein
MESNSLNLAPQKGAFWGINDNRRDLINSKATQIHLQKNICKKEGFLLKFSPTIQRGCYSLKGD